MPGVAPWQLYCAGASWPGGPGANAFSVHVAGIPARLKACHRDVHRLGWLRELVRTGTAGALRKGWGFWAPLGTAD